MLQRTNDKIAAIRARALTALEATFLAHACAAPPQPPASAPQSATSSLSLSATTVSRINLDTFCRMCGGLQFLNQQLLQRAQDAKVKAQMLRMIFRMRALKIELWTHPESPQAAVRRVCISFATALALACGDGSLTPAAGIWVFISVIMCMHIQLIVAEAAHASCDALAGVGCSLVRYK
jgi:hypothetical protein